MDASLDSCCVCSSSKHPTYLYPYYEPKVHDNQDNGVLVAINEELSEAYVLGDMKILDENNPVMLTISISQNELEVCKSIAVSFPYFMHKEDICVSHFYLLFLSMSLVDI